MIPFVKAHACGNDFLVIESAAVEHDFPGLARRLCARSTGVGADGIEFIERRTEGEIFLRLFNADGSEAELSGNGTRCVAAWLAKSEGITEVALGTHGGKRTCRIVEGDGRHYVVESGMGVPQVVQRTIVVDGVGEIAGAMVNVGNPHFVLFVNTDDFSSHGLSWQTLGERISRSSLFRFGANVEFVTVLSAQEIAFRIFERGCGPTMSSGTGTCASAAASIVLHGLERELTAWAEGGAQRVVWATNDSEMKLTGPAEIICTGEAYSS